MFRLYNLEFVIANAVVGIKEFFIAITIVGAIVFETLFIIAAYIPHSSKEKPKPDYSPVW